MKRQKQTLTYEIKQSLGRVEVIVYENTRFTDWNHFDGPQEAVSKKKLFRKTFGWPLMGVTRANVASAADWAQDVIKAIEGE